MARILHAYDKIITVASMYRSPLTLTRLYCTNI